MGGCVSALSIANGRTGPFTTDLHSTQTQEMSRARRSRAGARDASREAAFALNERVNRNVVVMRARPQVGRVGQGVRDSKGEGAAGMMCGCGFYRVSNTLRAMWSRLICEAVWGVPYCDLVAYVLGGRS